MAAREDCGLFEGLPEQVRPAAPAGGRPRLRMAERGQVELRALSLDDLVPPEHRVRQVWAFAEGLDLAPLYARIKAVEGRPGHPPADPRVLAALWLYATVEGVGSARELARLCDEHLAYQWLCGGVSVNHKTLSDFRVGHAEVIERLLTEGFAALLHAGVASLGRVAQDGMRVRADAGAASFRRPPTLRDCLRAAEAAVARQRRDLEADPAAASRRRAAEDRQRRVASALAAAERLRADQEGKSAKGKGARGKGGTRRDDGPAMPDGAAPGEAGGQADEPPKRKEPRVSTTDPEARVMKMADGGFRPAYNVQFASDTTTGLIAALSVDNIGSDMGKLAPMSDQVSAAYGCRPADHLVDGGFAKLDDITALAAQGVTVYAPVPEPRDPGRERHEPRPGDTDAVADWRRRMGTEAAKEIYKERAQTAEWVNALARNRGLLRLMVRGTAKVKAALLWFALAHNMACLWRLTAA